MKEIVIVSGKGGTGKTSVAASFATLAQNAILVDCDVDAADLHLVLTPTVEETHDFVGGRAARILSERCPGCGECANLCRYDAPYHVGDGKFQINPLMCEGCGVCVRFCPQEAIVFEEVSNGQWFKSSTRFGPFVHARLGIAEENSGKLVALIRKEARLLAESAHAELILVDGPPGIGCPVISSLTGADEAVVVTEPTISGMHDLERILTLTAHFQIATSIIINKADIYPEMADRIMSLARSQKVRVLGMIPYDPVVTQAQLVNQSVVEYANNSVSRALREIWSRLALTSIDVQ